MLAFLDFFFICGSLIQPGQIRLPSNGHDPWIDISNLLRYLSNGLTGKNCPILRLDVSKIERCHRRPQFAGVDEAGGYRPLDSFP